VWNSNVNGCECERCEFEQTVNLCPSRQHSGIESGTWGHLRFDPKRTLEIRISNLNRQWTCARRNNTREWSLEIVRKFNVSTLVIYKCCRPYCWLCKRDCSTLVGVNGAQNKRCREFYIHDICIHIAARCGATKNSIYIVYVYRAAQLGATLPVWVPQQSLFSIAFMRVPASRETRDSL